VVGRKILFNYIAVKIISALCVATFLCMVLGEFIGISFEQMRFLADNRISINTSILIHILAAPKFLVITLPYALLMANIVVYKELSRTSEIIALRSFGVSVRRILLPSRGAIQKVIIAPIAHWNSDEKIWSLSKGVEETIDDTQHRFSSSRSILIDSDGRWGEFGDNPRFGKPTLHECY
jgi:hypothetical protein